MHLGVSQNERTQKNIGKNRSGLGFAILYVEVLLCDPARKDAFEAFLFSQFRPDRATTLYDNFPSLADVPNSKTAPQSQQITRISSVALQT